jgi:glucose-1-phosphate thymidylyltransferase
MKIVVPVAGSGTRLRPHTYSQPKSLLFVGGKPMLAHVLDPIVKLDPEEVIFVIGYRGDQIREYVRENYSFPATFVTQDKLLGLGYALYLAANEIADGDMLVILGDTIVGSDLERFVKAGDNVLGVLPVEDPERFGIVTVENGRVTKLVEKPSQAHSNLAIIGLYYFKDVAPIKAALAGNVLSGRTTRGEIQFTDALQIMLEEGYEFVTSQVEEWFDCGKKETMLSTNRHIVAKAGNNPNLPGCTIIPPVYIDPSARIERSRIGPSVSIAENTVIRDSELQNCIVGRNSTIIGSVLTDSLIGNEVELKGGRLTANLGDSSELELEPDSRPNRANTD